MLHVSKSYRQHVQIVALVHIHLAELNPILPLLNDCCTACIRQFYEDSAKNYKTTKETK